MVSIVNTAPDRSARCVTRWARVGWRRRNAPAVATSRPNATWLSPERAARAARSASRPAGGEQQQRPWRGQRAGLVQEGEYLAYADSPTAGTPPARAAVGLEVGARASSCPPSRPARPGGGGEPSGENLDASGVALVSRVSQLGERRRPDLRPRIRT